VSFVTSTLPGLVVGVIVAIFSVWLTEKSFLRRHSNLVNGGVEGRTQLSQYVWRIKIVNEGKYPARNVRADVEKIESDGIPRKEIIVSPLNWMHNPTDLFTRDIYPNQTAYLDVCIANLTPNYDESFKLANPHVGSLDESSTIGKGLTKLTIGMYQESGQFKKMEVEIDWGGMLDAKSIKKTKVSIKKFS